MGDEAKDIVKQEGDNKHGAMISYGPCQTPTLGFCVKRWDELMQFQKETTFTVDLIVKMANGAKVTLVWQPPPHLLARNQGKGKGKGKVPPAWREQGTRGREVLDEFVQKVTSGGCNTATC